MTATYGNGTSRGRRLRDDELEERPISKGIVPSSAMPLRAAQPQTPQTPKLKKAGAVGPTATAQTATVGKRADYISKSSAEGRKRFSRNLAVGAAGGAAVGAAVGTPIGRRMARSKAAREAVTKRARYYDPEDRRQQRRGAAFGATSAAAGFTAARAFDAHLVHGARPASKNGLLVRNRSASVRLPGSRVGLLKLTSPKRLGVGALAGGGAIVINRSNRGSGNKRWR